MRDVFDKYSPDEGTQAKIKIVSYYFGIYFNIIEGVRTQCFKKYGWKSKIKYIDLFAGKGKFDDGSKSVPIRILEIIDKKEIDNISLIFNDLNHTEELITNIKNNPITKKHINKCSFTSDNAKDIDIESLINKSDIVLSFIDPSGYLRVDPKTIACLTKNMFSDCLFFLNINNFFMRIDVENERQNMIKLFGTETKLDEMIRLIKMDNGKRRAEKEVVLVNEILTSLKSESVEELYFLPFFIRYSSENTKIFNSIYLASKNRDALVKMKNSIKIEDFLHNDRGRFIGFVEDNPSQINLFENSYDADLILKHIPNDKYITRDNLLEFIDDEFIRKYTHISAYNVKDLNHALTDLYNNNIIEVEKTLKHKEYIQFGPAKKFRKV